MEALNKYFLDVVKNQYFDFDGRTSREYFWMFVIFNITIQIVIYIVAVIIGKILNSPTIAISITGLVTLGLFLPSMGNVVRRLHDINKSGWWLLICAIPIVNFALIYFWVLQGDDSENRYGSATE